MSRTFNTDPRIVRAYRAERRPIDPDWRTRFRRCPPEVRWASPEWYAWLDDEPDLPPPYDWYRIGEGSAEDRRLMQRRYRALVRDLIAHERYDDIQEPRATKGWEDWAW